MKAERARVLVNLDEEEVSIVCPNCKNYAGEIIGVDICPACGTKYRIYKDTIEQYNNFRVSYNRTHIGYG